MNANKGVKTVALFSEPYLDTYNQCYKNIITLNAPPQGPLRNIVRRVNFTPLSPFKQPGPCEKIKMCGLALISENSCYKNGCNLMVVDEVPNLFSYLMTNGYNIDTKITNMLNKTDLQFNGNINGNNGKTLICFITYQG